HADDVAFSHEGVACGGYGGDPSRRRQTARPRHTARRCQKELSETARHDRQAGCLVTDLLYLRQDIQVEPLVDQWYAWSHLIPPATTARNITHRHFRIMDSYVNSPRVHATAVKDPQMLGGPFIDHARDRSDE